MMTTNASSFAPVSFGVVPRAARAALQWRLLLLWVLLMLIPTAIVSLTLYQTLSAQLDYSVHAAAIAQQLDMTVFADLMAAHGKNAAGFSSAGVMALIVTLLISPLLSGMAATAARFPGTPGFRALVSGALAEYPRMLRMLLWSVVPLGVAVALGGMAMDAAAEHGARAIVESSADLAFHGALAVSVLLFALAHATLDAGRAALTIERRRTSAVKAWWSGCKLLLRRPLATLGIYIAISAVGLALAGALVVGRINVAGASFGGFIGALLLVQLTVAVLGWMRSARLFALVELARVQRG
jgi:hypothetical protein